MKIIAIIPARLKSTRLKEKMLIPIGGKPLIQHTFENAQKCHFLDDVFIATDDERIALQAKNFQAKVLMTSPLCKNGTERLVDALERYPELKQTEIVVNIQGDHPCIAVDTLSKTIEALQNDPVAVCSTAATKITYNEANYPHIVKCVMDSNNNALYFSRSLIPFNKAGLDKPHFYYHIGLYVYRTDFLLTYPSLTSCYLQEMEDLEQLKILEHGFRIKVAVVDDKPAGVDVEEDLKKVEKILCP